MADQLFGPLLSFHDVEFALIGHTKLWLNTFLAARERKVGMTAGSVARPKSWVARQTFNLLPGDDSTPSIVVVSNGTTEEPVRHGDGGYDVEFRTAVTALCHGREATVARRLAGHYQAALLDLLLKKKKFNLFDNTSASVNRWLGIGLDDIDETQTRTLCSARLEFVIVVRDFSESFGGPATIPVDPLVPQPDGPTVQGTTITDEVLP